MNTTARCQQIVSGSNGFGLQLLAHLASLRLDSPPFLSPTSIATALAMTYNGSSGETRRVMAATLGLAGLAMDDVNGAFVELIGSLVQTNTAARLALANAIWVHNQFRLRPAFRRVVGDAYSAQVAELDFHSPEAADVINAWVSAQTQARIPTIVEHADVKDAVAALTNAVHFKGTWAEPFDRTLTADMPFTTLAGRVRHVPTMVRRDQFSYYEDAAVQCITLPYAGGRLAMTIVLPRRSLPFSAFCRLITPEAWRAWSRQGRARLCRLALPRVKAQYESNLKDALIALGMGIAFTDAADFSLMAERPVKISKVIHKTWAEVSEEGTEAAGATAVVMEYATARPPDPEIPVIVDRPFLCAIHDVLTGALLFIGLIADPSATQ